MIDNLRKRHLETSLMWALFALSTAWFFGSCFFGKVLNNDECYMAISCRYYEQQPIAMMSFWLGNLWMRLFGDQVISLRLLSALIYYLAIMIPMDYFVRRRRNVRWGLLLAVAGMVTVRGMKLTYYGWDSAPVWCLSALLTLLVSYLRAPARGKAVGAGVLWGILLLMRIPAAGAALPMMMAAIWWGDRRVSQPCGPRLITYLAMGLAAVVIILLLTTMMCGSPGNYLDCWRSENFINGHSPSDFRVGFWPHIKWDCAYIANSYRLHRWYFLWLVIVLMCKERWRYVVGSVAVAYLIWRKIRLDEGPVTACYFIGIMLLLRSVIRMIQVHFLKKEKEYKVEWSVIMLCVGFALVTAVGSDWMLQRMSFFYSLPLLLDVAYPLRGKWLKWVVLLMFVPPLVSDAYFRCRQLEEMQREEHRLPYHRYILDYSGQDEYIQPLGAVIQRLEKEGKTWSTFGSWRYGPLYLYEHRVPFKFNAFHYYYRDETLSVLKENADSMDALVIFQDDTPAMSYEEIKNYLSCRKFELTDSAGAYHIFEKIKYYDR